ncbi:MAG TPA: inositol monophosphatase family protein [Bacteroidia bacterium]|jgi:myo-inositol-1(or 4)-monophosphatase|nr:inositol monophosphatase family protein [Bacteroidia bacterium]
MNSLNLQEICKQACEAARQAGAFIREEQKKIKPVQVEEKSRNSLVTYVDKKSEQILVNALKSLIPGAGFMTEEETTVLKGEAYNWIIDPLDGTTNFIHGIPCYAVSIGLERAGKTILGIVYEVNLDECFYAWENSKAYLNGNEINVSKTANLKDSLIATGFPYYDHTKETEYLQLFREYMHSTRGLRRLGSAATDLAYVACGRFEAFYEYSLHPWDVSGGAFIVQQAGGIVCDFKGKNNYIYGKSIVACNPHIAVEFMKKLNRFF